jgi:hypothetical protein
VVVPIAKTPVRRALVAQKNVSRAIFLGDASSNVFVSLDNANRIVLRGSAPSASWRQRLLQVATAAAGGYTILDQLALTAVGSAASSLTAPLRSSTPLTERKAEMYVGRP